VIHRKKNDLLYKDATCSVLQPCPLLSGSVLLITHSLLSSSVLGAFSAFLFRPSSIEFFTVLFLSALRRAPFSFRCFFSDSFFHVFVSGFIVAGTQ